MSYTLPSNLSCSEWDNAEGRFILDTIFLLVDDNKDIILALGTEGRGYEFGAWFAGRQGEERNYSQSQWEMAEKWVGGDRVTLTWEGEGTGKEVSLYKKCSQSLTVAGIPGPLMPLFPYPYLLRSHPSSSIFFIVTWALLEAESGYKPPMESFDDRWAWNMSNGIERYLAEAGWGERIILWTRSWNYEWLSHRNGVLSGIFYGKDSVRNSLGAQ